MQKEIWKLTVAVEGYDVLFFKVWAVTAEEAKSEMDWRMEWLVDIPWHVIDTVKCKDMVYGE